jgi:hypothetical protein
MSGALVGPMLALRLGKGFIVCRKPQEESHGGSAEGSLSCGGDYIIVDDFISSGATIHGIIEAIADYRERFNWSQIWSGGGWDSGCWRNREQHEQIPPFTCVGVFLYDSARNENIRSKSKYNLDGEISSDEGYEIPVFNTRYL